MTEDKHLQLTLLSLLGNILDCLPSVSKRWFAM